MKQYPVQLDTTSKKHTCPNCGKKTFVAYVHSDTLQPVDSSRYGRCDRQNNCAYHVHPKDDPDYVHETPVELVQEEIIQIYPSDEEVKRITGRTKTCVSPFHQWCKGLGIPMEHLLKWGVYSDDDRTVFLFQRYGDNRVTNWKYFKYQVNGHRDKSYNAHSLRQPHSPSTPKKTSKGDVVIKRKKYLLGLFGEHLLNYSKKRTVCVVESEKTAVIAAHFYPDYDWVAAMSCNGLTDERVGVLQGRRVIWLCDNDDAGRKNSSINRGKRKIEDFNVADLFPAEDYPQGYDLADAIVDGLRPEITVTESFKEEGKEDKLNRSVLYDLPDGVKFDDVKEDIERYGFFIHRNSIYVIRQNKGKEDGYYAQRVTNFKVAPLGLIESRFFPRRLIKIRNVYKNDKVLEVPTKAFASNTDFTVFVESEGNYQWNGTVADLKRLRSQLYDKMPSYEEVDSLGWHREGYFIFANGVYNGTFKPIDEYGFVKMGKKNFYIEALSNIHKDSDEDWEDEKKFIYTDRKDVTLKEWAALFCRVHKDNGRIALAWFVTSLFRDFIYQRFKFFPHLFLFGPPGTGKSQLGWSIRAMGFAGIKKPFNLSGGTQVAFYREFSHFTNFPCWFDEYDNSIDYQRVQSLKAAYDGAGHKKSVKDSDKRTKTVPVNSACMISGQQLPIADNALFKRVILTQFHQTDFTQEEKDLFSKLQDMENGGLTAITTEIIKERKVIEKKYLDTFEEVLEDMEDSVPPIALVEDRIMRNMCIVLAVIKLLGTRLDLGMTYETLKPIALKYILEQMALISGNNETNTFWDMVSYLIDQDLIKEEEDYKFRATRSMRVYVNGEVVDRELNETTTILYLRTSRVIPLYREHFKRQNSSTSAPMDKGSLIHYLQHQKYYLNLIKGTKFRTGKMTQGGAHKEVSTTAYAFNYDLMEQMGIELKRGDSEYNINNNPAEPAAVSGNGQSVKDPLQNGENGDDLPF